MKKIKNTIVMSLFLTFAWVMMNNKLDIITILIGLGLSVTTALIMCHHCDLFSEWRITPKSILYSFFFLFIFLWEMIKSNLDVAFRVLSPSLPIKPGIVTVKTKLTSKMGKLLLANSITLTPGTLTVDIKDNLLYIHWIDVKDTDIESATKDIVSKFEKYLEVIYG